MCIDKEYARLIISAFNSGAIIERWNGEKWVKVTNIIPELMNAYRIATN